MEIGSKSVEFATPQYNSMKRLELLSSVLQYIHEIFGIDLPVFVVPFVAELYIEYAGELFNQNILLQDNRYMARVEFEKRMQAGP